MWLKPFKTKLYFNRQLKQTANISKITRYLGYSLPFTSVNGLMQLSMKRGFNPMYKIIYQWLIQ